MSAEAAVTEPPQTEVKESVSEESVDTNTEVSDTKTEKTTETKEESFDPSKIDPKVKEHFEKEYSTRYHDYENVKREAQEFNQLKNDQRFQQWVQSISNPPKKEFEISDDQFTQALTDKSQFARLVQEAAKHLLQTEVGPKLAQTDQRFQFEAKKNELSGVIQKYPDFKELDKRGLIEPLIVKYPNLGFEDAYWLAKRHTFKEEVAKAARGQVEERKGSTTERPNNAPSARRNVVKVSDRLEAMERAAEDFRAGREIAEYEYDN